MVKQLILSLFLILLGARSIASTSYFLEGTIGKARICMRFEDFTESYPNDEPRITDVRYYYLSSLKDIVLEGTRNKNQFTFLFNEEAGKYDEKFVLTKDAKGIFKGNWFHKSGKKLAVILKPIQVNAIKNPYKHIPFINAYKNSDPFEYLRSSKLSFKTDSLSKYHNQLFRWVRETHGTCYGFYLDSTFKPTVRHRVNPKLEEILIENAMNQLSCATQWDYSDGSGIEISYHLNFLNADLLSFTIWQSWFCGGAHPDFGYNSYLIDLNTGKEYALEELIAFDKSAVVYDEKADNFTDYVAYQRDFFAPRILQMLIEQGSVYTDYNSEEDPCMELYNDPESWTFANWEYTAEGLRFSCSVARAARACETESFTIPFGKFAAYKQSSFPYSFPK
jgi:hypothetical protein